MNLPTRTLQPAARLQVALRLDDTRRRAELAAIVTAAGHALVETGEEADVVLTDHGGFDSDGPAVVTLGVEDVGQAASLPEHSWPAQIDAALRAAAAGLIVRTVGSAPPAFRSFREQDAGPLLTPREIEVLAALGDGLSNKEAARRLGISQHTVKFHVESLFRKLDTTSRAEAVHKGLKRGLIEL
jgi:DNA-binding NarL/FixJ family response regulator